MNLKAIRQEKGITQAALAEMIGVDQSTINRAENMHESAKLLTYVRCAEALGVTLSDIFGESRSALETELIKAFREVPPARHQELLAMLRLVRARD